MHHVGAEGFLPGVGGIADGQSAYVADQGVDAAQFVGRSGDPGSQRGSIGHVEGAPERLDTLRFQGRDSCGYLICVPRSDRDVRPLRSEPFGDSPTDFLAATGNDGPSS